MRTVTTTPRADAQRDIKELDSGRGTRGGEGDGSTAAQMQATRGPRSLAGRPRSGTPGVLEGGRW